MVLISLASRAGSIQLLDSRQFLRSAGRGTGVANLCIVSPIDGVAFSVNENADPDVRTDHLAAIPRLHAPGSGQSLLFRKSLTLPYSSSGFSMGTWQGIYLIDLRESNGPVEVEVTCRPSWQRAEFSVMAAARSATQLENDIGKRLPVEAGAVLVHEKHTSASLSIGSGNLEPAMNKVVPEQWHHEFFQHTLEGPDDMTGHLKCSLLGCSATVPFLLGVPLAPVRLNEHRYAGGYGVGHHRKISLDHLPETSTSFDLALSGTAEIGKELATREGVLVNILAMDGRGGLLMGSKEAVESFQVPDEAVLARSLDWPVHAAAKGMQLWWFGGAAKLHVTPF
mmetsp:Transcript_3733/g.8716  ORF Transcript_3733/g.8716 Transcript_3733/m.8716 type:complete len:338 (+) Transcript_3733:44-1057(+)